MAIKIRDYEVRLVRGKEERKLVRQLRYKCFTEDAGWSMTEEQKELKEEYDDWDLHADYMGVFQGDRIVGTYRILDRAAAEKSGGFYSESEFDISKIKRRRGNIAEMSRACVDADYRDDGLVLSMLWLGLGEYVLRNKIQILFGLGSWWKSSNPADTAQAISYLYYNHLAPLGFRAVVDLDKLDPAVDPRMTRMNILPKAFVDKDRAFKELPPLIKGYLRLGGMVGKGVSISAKEDDYSVFVMCLTKDINKAYQKRFTGNPNAFDDLGVKDTVISTVVKILSLPFKGAFFTLKAVATLLLSDADLRDAEVIKDEQNDSKGV
jgi:putative hemolysin